LNKVGKSLHSKEKAMKKLLLLLAICIGGFAQAQNNSEKVALYNKGFEAFKNMAYTESEKYFREYIRQYPNEIYGYYWCFRSRQEMDKILKLDVAREDALSVIRIAEQQKNKNQQLISAYQYLATSDLEIHKNFNTGLSWINKILELDPSNEWAVQQKEALTGRMNKEG
jgi:tetratricopeptide (TPR) repeat protein